MCTLQLCFTANVSHEKTVVLFYYYSILIDSSSVTFKWLHMNRQDLFFDSIALGTHIQLNTFQKLVAIYSVPGQKAVPNRITQQLVVF